MPRIQLWCGLDVGADEMAVCCVDDSGGIALQQRIPNCAAAFHTALKSQKRRIKLVGLEAGSYGITLTRNLRRLGYPTAVFDSRQASKFLTIRHNKTDKNDARGLADVARLGQSSVSQIRVKSPECQRLRSTLVTRQRLVRVRCALESTLRSLFRLNGGKLKPASSAATLKRNVAQALSHLRKTAKVDLAADVEPLLALSEVTRRRLELLDKRLTQIATESAICRRFLDIPGVGPLCALSLYTAVEDPTRFRRSADIGPYFGMVPSLRESGQVKTRLRISKRGDAMTRSYLAQAALAHLRYGDSDLTDWGKALTNRVGSRRAQIAVGRKLAVMMIAMWKKNQAYEPRRGHGLGDNSMANQSLDLPIGLPCGSGRPETRSLPCGTADPENAHGTGLPEVELQPRT